MKKTIVRCCVLITLALVIPGNTTNQIPEDTPVATTVKNVPNTALPYPEMDPSLSVTPIKRGFPITFGKALPKDVIMVP